MRPFRSVFVASLALCVVACKGEDEAPPSRGDEERTIMTVQSYVYAQHSDTNLQIVQRIKDQIRSAFGALKSQRVTGSNKEISNDPGKLLYREAVVMVEESGRETMVWRVWFRFTDEVFASATVPRGAPMLVGGLHRQDDARAAQIVAACAPSTVGERDYRDRLQAVFDGSLTTCQDAITAEQAVIDAARVRLDDPEDEIVPEELDRTYLPVVVRILARKASQMGQYPRFQEVVPYMGSAAVATAPEAARGRRAAGDADSGGDSLGEPLFGDSKVMAASDDTGPTPIVVPYVGAGDGPPQRGEPSSEEEPSDPDMDIPDEPRVAMPVVVAGAPKGPAAPVQPRGDGGSNFEWSDLLDKKFLALWVAVFALYPLLRRRSGGGI